MSDSKDLRSSVEELDVTSPRSAQCFKCKKIVSVIEYEILETSNKHKRLSGNCPECKKKVSSFIASLQKPSEKSGSAEEKKEVDASQK